MLIEDKIRLSFAKRGRPKGSKNKEKPLIEQENLKQKSKPVQKTNIQSECEESPKKRGRKALWKKEKYNRYDGSLMAQNKHPEFIKCGDHASISTANSQSSTSSTDNSQQTEERKKLNKKGCPTQSHVKLVPQKRVSSSNKQKLKKKVDFAEKKEIQTETIIEEKRNTNQVTKEYKLCLKKAQKCLEYSNDMKTQRKDQIKYFLNKAISYYKRAFEYSKTDKDKARLHVLIADCHTEICPKQYEHDQKGKQLAKACESIKQAQVLSKEFDDQIQDDLQLKIKSLIQKQLIDKIDDGELLCTLFENIFQHLTQRIPKLMNFVGGELYQSYYRIASEIADFKGDLENATRYLTQCKVVAKAIGIEDRELIDVKLQEIKNMKKRHSSDRNLQEAKSSMQLGDMYLQNNQLDEALIQYKQALKLCKDNTESDVEAICNFRVGKILFTQQQHLEKARNHLVDFQIQSNLSKDKNELLNKKKKEAATILNEINQILKSRRANQPQNKSRYQDLLEREKNPKRNPQPKFETETKIQNDSKELIPDFKKLLTEIKSKDIKLETISEFSTFLQSNFKNLCKDLINIDQYCEPAKLRKYILKYITVFHPDKHQDNKDQYFLELTEEITKILNLYLSRY